APLLGRVEEALGALPPRRRLRGEGALDAGGDVEEVLDARDRPLGDRRGPLGAQARGASAERFERGLRARALGRGREEEEAEQREEEAGGAHGASRPKF